MMCLGFHLDTTHLIQAIQAYPDQSLVLNYPLLAIAHASVGHVVSMLFGTSRHMSQFPPSYIEQHYPVAKSHLLE